MNVERPRQPDVEYLQRVELLAHAVCEQAVAEGWLTYLPEDHEQSPLQRSINELARHLRQLHFEGDGCADHR